jgi:tRNA uridine 5-carbamoylmethylation protein Kti12
VKKNVLVYLNSNELARVSRVDQTFNESVNKIHIRNRKKVNELFNKFLNAEKNRMEALPGFMEAFSCKQNGIKLNNNQKEAVKLYEKLENITNKAGDKLRNFLLAIGDVQTVHALIEYSAKYSSFSDDLYIEIDNITKHFLKDIVRKIQSEYATKQDFKVMINKLENLRSIAKERISLNGARNLVKCLDIQISDLQ